MRSGVRLGVDVGKVRVGLAASDPHGMIATPIATLQRGESPIAAIVREAEERDALEILVGLPLSLSGGSTPSTDDAVGFARELAAATERPVRLIDERLTTVSAQSQLRQAGRSAKRQRSVVDQVAAVILVQHALDSERSSGRPPGRPVD
ncbi:Holliday junction resolvase RuvX [Desertivibrio insolitus]|uniref:Holliday junction resolvase RuvX n=1 Tax=Herbiconiux sp. SYSU D00978 TaxID=2812562 RepID=UPI001A95ACBA|nr:Holliday junction resolvase RuvX [Herbiconiux sp. SYSU D00978]